MRILALYNLKGGVGKSTSAVNLGWLAAQDGFRTLVWDLDPQGASTFAFRVRPKEGARAKHVLRGSEELLEAVRGTDFEGLDLLPADFSNRKLDVLLHEGGEPRRLARLLSALDGEYDLVLLDCAPSISVLAEAVFEAADALLVPTIPSPLSIRTLVQLLQHLKSRAGHHTPRVLPFFCLVDRRKALHRKVCAYAAEQVPLFLRTAIPSSSLVEQMAVRRAPLPTFAPGSPAAQAYAELWREVQERLDGASDGAQTPGPGSVRSLLEDVDPPRG